MAGYLVTKLCISGTAFAGASDGISRRYRHLYTGGVTGDFAAVDAGGADGLVVLFYSHPADNADYAVQQRNRIGQICLSALDRATYGAGIVYNLALLHHQCR